MMNFVALNEAEVTLVDDGLGEVNLDHTMELNLTEDERNELIDSVTEKMQIDEGTKAVNELYDELDCANKSVGEMVTNSKGTRQVTDVKGEKEKEKTESETNSKGTRQVTDVKGEKKKEKTTESEPEPELSELEKLRKEIEKLKSELKPETADDTTLPFGLEPDRYLKVDQKEAMTYLAKTIIPRIKRVIDENRAKFVVIFALGESCEPIDYETVKTCSRYNQGWQCGEGKIHTDAQGNKRSHSCTICWEALWVYTPHRVINCPLLTVKFWKLIGAERLP